MRKWWKDLFDSEILFDLIWATVIIVGLICLSGCSASKKIADSAVNITAESTKIRATVVQAEQALAAENYPLVKDHLKTIDKSAVVIVEEAATISREVTQVDDKVAYWQKMLKWLGLGAVAIAGVFLMWRLNLFLAFEKIGQGIVNLIAKLMGA